MRYRDTLGLYYTMQLLREVRFDQNCKFVMVIVVENDELCKDIESRLVTMGQINSVDQSIITNSSTVTNQTDNQLKIIESSERKLKVALNHNNISPKEVQSATTLLAQNIVIRKQTTDVLQKNPFDVKN
jgi:hypothetical protein